MSFEPPDGILDIGNATLRVGKLEVAETSGLNQGLQNIIKNDLLITENNESSPYTTNQKWGIKLPTTWVAEFEVKGQSGKYIDFNFYNENSASNALGYNLTFMDTTMTLRYDGGSALGGGAATIPTIVGAYRKVNIFFERGVISVSIDGTRYLYHKETDGFNQGLGVASRVVSTTGSAFVNVFIESDNENNSAFKNLRIVNGRFISDKTSNIAFIGGNLGVGVNSPKESLDIRGNMHLTRVSNVSQIKVDSNVVTEYTGPHDRPLRKYPEVAMTANDNSTTSGYVADQTAFSGNADGYAYRLFDHSLSTAYQSGGSQYSGGDSTSSAQTTTATDGTTHQGVAITLDLATKIRLSYAKITSHTYYGRTPVEGTFLGSNNNSTWDVIGTFAGLSTTASGQTHTVHIADYATKSAYRYIRLVVTKVHTSAVQNGGSLLEFKELEYYGHEEGSASLDTTLKTVYNVPATTGTQLEVYYDAKDLTTMPSTVTDLSPNTNTGAVSGHSPTLDSTDGIDSFKFNGSSQYVTGAHGLTTGSDPVHTISLWLNAVELTDLDYVVQLGQGGTSHQQSAIIFKDNKIGHAHWGSGVLSEVTIANNVWYHVVAVFTGGNGSDLSKHKIFINGEDGGVGAFPGSTDGPVVLTGTQLTLGRNNNQGGTPGNYLKGSIANFRLYSKVLNADQVKELYDYQKDYFLGSKSQVTLYKGHLGVGVTEPSGQLELAGDERIQEYPPRGMTGYETYMEGHGAFCVSASSTYSSYYPWEAFEHVDSDLGWHSLLSVDPFSGTNNAYSGSSAIGNYTGAFLKLKLPYKIELKSFSVRNRSDGSTNANSSPEDFKIIGSNDETNWEELFSISGVVWASTQINKIYSITSNPKTYRYLAFVCTRTVADTSVIIGHIKFFGTPGPTTLDKGSLSLTRSLDVPRVSRYDVDTETPRPEKLVLDFDTTVNSSPTDISGQGNHGRFVGTAQYSPADKAFTGFPSSSANYITGNILGASGAYAHTQSYWINGVDATPRVAFTLGAETGNYSYANLYWYTGSGAGWVLNTDGAAGASWVEDIQDNRWYHVVLTYDGGSSTSSWKFYLDGEYKTPTTMQANAALSLASNPEYRIGRNNGTQWYNGMVSNPKVYSVALEPSEVKKLYRLGRTGRSMVISDTAVGIGKVPEAQLDVRGNLAVRGDIEAYGKNFNMSPAGNLSILGSIYGASVTAPYVRSYWNTYGFDGAWRTLIGTGVYDCGIGFLVHQTADDTAMFRFAHNGAGTKHVGWIYNSGYTSITYSGSNIKIQGPGGISRAYILYLNT